MKKNHSKENQLMAPSPAPLKAFGYQEFEHITYVDLHDESLDSDLGEDRWHYPDLGCSGGTAGDHLGDDFCQLARREL